MRFMAEEMTTVGSGMVMAVILVFLLLGGLIVSFFGDLIFTVAAFALLAALLIGRLAWIQSAWVSVTNQPITGIVQPGYPLTIYMGLSTCILFSLKSLLTQSRPNHTRVATPVQTEAPSRLPAEAQKAASSDTDALVALVLQRSRTIQTIIEKSLGKAAIQSVCVSDESAARHALETSRIDLLVADATLHEKDRSAALRDLCRRKGIPVLTLSAKKTSGPQPSHAGATLTMPIIPDEHRALGFGNHPAARGPALCI
jgi:hypothetical protein